MRAPYTDRLLSALGLLAVLALFTPACSSEDRSAAQAPPAAVEPESPAQPAFREEEPAARADVDQLQRLRTLGYVAGGGTVPKEAVGKRARKAPDTGALSELDYRNAQNLSQRAHEALDYLGDFDREAGGRQAATRGERDAKKSRGQQERIPADEVHRLRDRLRAAVVARKGDDRFGAGLASPGPGEADLASEPEDQLSPAQRFQRARSSLESLSFQPGTGYWANTYVPGDPVMRWLESRLEKRDRTAVQRFASRPLQLEAAAHPLPQPFDPPGSAALSVFVQADRRGLEREERMLVQVGLQGANRRVGLRPAMSVGIVLDVRGAPAAAALSSMRALVDAFLAAKDVGDRFSLTVAGKPGGELVAPEAFRHGPLSLAMADLAARVALPPPAPNLDLVEAVRRTAGELQRGDDPTAPLGSSMVLLVTSQPLGAHADALVAAAHRSAVAGVPVSVVAIGDGVDPVEVERVTLAGQGNRRLMHDPAEAEALVDRELSALARVIARALRLNIRLAPGVKLVEVVGAERLDAAGAEEVRQAERSIDRRLSRNLGIAKDRGRDEDGIQIVIPTFQSGDSHAVLLDVVAPGPGPIADVTVRYKDLVYLRNSVARANLTLGVRTDPPGPLERNVVKNFLAIRLADSLKRAGRSLLEGGDAEAVALVGDFRALLDSLQSEVPGFQNDADLASDAAMLDDYLALLRTDVLDRDEPRQYLADSLQLSGYLKTVPRPSPGVRIARR